MNHMHLSDAIENSNVMHGIRGCMCFPISRLHHEGELHRQLHELQATLDRLTRCRACMTGTTTNILSMWMSSIKKCEDVNMSCNGTLPQHDPAGVVDPTEKEPHQAHTLSAGLAVHAIATMALTSSSEQQPLSSAHLLFPAHPVPAVATACVHVTYVSLSQLAQPCSERPRKRHIATTMIMFDFAMAPVCTLGDDL